MFEHPLKNAYIGEVYEYSYDFRNKSVATLQTDGWAFSRNGGTATSGWEFVTNGFHNTNTNDSNKLGVIARSMDFSTAKKITVTADLYCVQGSWNGSFYFCVSTTGTYPLDGPSMRVNSMNNSGYTGFGGYLPSNSTGVFNRTTLSTGNYTATYILDLSSKVATCRLGNYTDVTLTMLDTDVTYTRNADYFAMMFDKSNIYCKNVSVKIKY